MKVRITLKVRGVDAQSFLQGQLSNDIVSIGENEWQLNAYCQHQGKVIALFWVTKYKNDFYLNFPKSLQDKIFKHLNMFVLMSDVEIVQTSFNAYPPIDVMKHPEVYLITSEKFVPQELNLDINEVGVNFSKGCYPGQEIVARLHYLGKPKRRMRLFECEQILKVGDKLIVLDSKSVKASGIVVRCIKSSGKLLYLATIEVKYQDSDIISNNSNNAKFTRIKND